MLWINERQEEGEGCIFGALAKQHGAFGVYLGYCFCRHLVVLLYSLLLFGFLNIAERMY